MESNEEVKRLALLAQSLINDLYKRDPDNETFEQNGILNGQEIVQDFIDNQEHGIAIEHLLYIVHESDISFPKTELEKLHSLANKCGINSGYVKKMPNKFSLPRPGKSPEAGLANARRS